MQNKQFFPHILVDVSLL